jgi:phage baseplate assembly protein V
MDSVLKNLIRVGRISSTDPTACTARVAFEDKSNMVSYELPILVKGSLQNKDYWMPVPGEQVVCLFLPSGNAQGFILGAFYSKKDQPPVVDGNKRHISFSDGGYIEYDSSTNTLTISADVTVDGNLEVTGSAGGMQGNLDGGQANSVYGGIPAIDCGGAG